MTPLTITLLVFAGVPALGLFGLACRWGAAPLAGAVGFLVFLLSLYADWGRGMRFGGGLFVFSMLLFLVSGGMRGR